MRKIRAGGYAVSASYLHRTRSVKVQLNNGLYLSFFTRTVRGLVCAKAADLSQIEISASALGLHWPALDVDVYVPGLLRRNVGARPHRGIA